MEDLEWIGGVPRVVITGGTSGIGRACVERLVGRGVEVVMASRDTDKAHRVCSEVNDRFGCERTHAVSCDLASFESVRHAAAEICERFTRAEALVACAGVFPAKRQLTVDGHELSFQVNHLSHFLLANLLRPALIDAAPSRVVVVSSDAHHGAYRGIRFNDLDFESGFSPFAAYAHSKLANIMFAIEAAERWAGTGVAVNAVHPGAANTGMRARSMGAYGAAWNRFAKHRSPDDGAKPIVSLAIAPQFEGTSGLYLYQERVKRPSRAARDRSARKLLWNVSARLTGLSFEGQPAEDADLELVAG